MGLHSVDMEALTAQAERREALTPPWPVPSQLPVIATLGSVTRTLRLTWLGVASFCLAGGHGHQAHWPGLLSAWRSAK